MSYKEVEVWQLAREIVIEIHKMSLSLPKFETFEEGQQIRRSRKSVKGTIVEGYGRRRYKNEYIKFLVYAHASTEEKVDHLELFDTGSLTGESLFTSLKQKLGLLGCKLNTFIKSVK